MIHRLTDLSDADRSRMVFVCPTPAEADALASIGVLAICIPAKTPSRWLELERWTNVTKSITGFRFVMLRGCESPLYNACQLQCHGASKVDLLEIPGGIMAWLAARQELSQWEKLRDLARLVKQPAKIELKVVS